MGGRPAEVRKKRRCPYGSRGSLAEHRRASRLAVRDLRAVGSGATGGVARIAAVSRLRTGRGGRGPVARETDHRARGPRAGSRAAIFGRRAGRARWCAGVAAGERSARVRNAKATATLGADRAGESRRQTGRARGRPQAAQRSRVVGATGGRASRAAVRRLGAEIADGATATGLRHHHHHRPGRRTTARGPVGSRHADAGATAGVGPAPLLLWAAARQRGTA